MVRTRHLRGQLMLAVLMASAMSSSEAEAQPAAVDPAATQLLRRMTVHVGSMGQFSLDTHNIFEDVLESGQKIQHELSTSVVVQRPNRIRAERRGDLVDQTVVYDGKTLTVHNETSNHYASAAAPDNIDAALHFARDALDIVPPSSDLIYSNAFDLLTAQATSGKVIGKSMIGGVKCDHLAFAGPVVDWQIWISEGDKPLPLKYVIVTKNDPVQPQFIVRMSNWNVTPTVTDATFRFVPPAGAKQVEFMRMDAVSPSASKSR